MPQPTDRNFSLTIASLLLLEFFAAAALIAQSRPTAVRFDHLSVEDGLSHPRVTAIHQDSRGFLWLATADGLNRYDGYDFRVYLHDPEDPDSLADSRVTAIHEDQEGRLLIGTHGAGLDLFDLGEDRFKHHRHDPDDPESLAHDLVWDVLQDRRGEVWVATQDGLDRRLGDGGFVHYRHDPRDVTSLADDAVFVLYEDRRGELWVGTGGGLHRLAVDSEGRRTGGFVRYRHDPDDPRSLSHDEVTAIREDAAGRLWVATKAGLNVLDPGRSETVGFVRYRHRPGDPTSLASDEIRSLAGGQGGELWVATSTRGLDRFDPAAGVVRHHFRHDPQDSGSLRQDTLEDVFEDETGILWIATGDGLDKFDRRRERFAVFRREGEPALSSNSVSALHEARDGGLWIGSRDMGLDHLDADRRVVTHFATDPNDPGSLPHAYVSALWEDRSGTLWVGTTGGGLARFDHLTGRFERRTLEPGDPQAASNAYVSSLVEDRDGRLWVATAQGVFYLPPDGGQRGGERGAAVPFEGAGGTQIGRDWFLELAEDRSGTLWLGTQSQGLYRLDPGPGEPSSRRLRHYVHDPSREGTLTSDKIAVVLQGQGGTIWVGTAGGGVNRLDAAADRFVHTLEKDGLASNRVTGLEEDDDGRLWVSTYRGLSRLDPASGKVHSFGLGDGLPGLSFTPRAAVRTADGELVFGSDRGLVAFAPDDIEIDPTPPRLVFTDFRLFNEPVPLARTDPSSPLERSILETEEIVLGHRQYAFSIELAALHFTEPRQNLYRYQLEGFDADWITADASARRAQYSNLPPGRYVLRFRGANSDGVWNPDEATLRLVVLPPPWKTWWAYTLYAAAVLLAASGYARTLQRKVDREREVNRRLREVDRLKEELLAQSLAARDELEQRVHERTARIEALLQDLKNSNAELQSFTYTVSHDLKSPLVTVKGFLGYLEQDAAKGDVEKVESDVRHIRGAVDKMHRLIDDLLELSRVGRGESPAEAVEMTELVAEVVELLSGEIGKRGVEVEVAPDLPRVVGERTRLQQLMQNLVANAVRYMGDTEKPRIEVGWQEREGEAVFWVRDNGLGIDPRHHERIFGLFQRLDAASEGTGVGLALVRKIVELHGGRIWVESDGAGRGSTFFFTLPDAPVVPPPASG